MDDDTAHPAKTSTSNSNSERCCCRRPQQRQHLHNSSWRLRMLVVRYATIILMSMLLLLTTAQDVNNHQATPTATKVGGVERGASNAFSTLSLSEADNYNVTHTLANLTNEQSEQSEQSELNEPNEQRELNEPSELRESQVSNRRIVSSKAGLELSAANFALPAVSMSRNSLISGDSVLQRQLREKAKQDSLESIKIHILMRLNLKRLPNITKPIAVPQNILENFYKTYNASILSTTKKRTIDQTLPNTENPTASLENSSSEMQADDTNAFKDYLPFIQNFNFDEHRKFDSDYTLNGAVDAYGDNGEQESILSHISSIYVFPEQHKEPHLRHNRKSDVLRFKIDTGYSDISYVTLHLYLRGFDWIRSHQPKILEEFSDAKQNQDIIVALHRPIRRTNSSNYTHKAKMFEFRHKIPSGQGQWVNVDLKPLFGAVGQMTATNQTQELLIKGVDPWMRPLIVTMDNDASSKNPLTVHIEIGTKKKNRRKRSVFMDCTESDHDMRCCRYPLKVNFTSFGWHFVVAPTSFDAYFCSGDCRVGYLEQYPHTHITALTTSATPCCSPTKMSSLSLLYFDDNHNLVLSVIPNMSVEGCSCS
ncbi:GH23936 [Drosophila grimshawi]|uniref:GH23936 n=2 Tax=Drosophila grimshawi TaxID=7222 RepID=B4JZU0_DROGR|nr:GH23936 [Drosophila grimshawi]